MAENKKSFLIYSDTINNISHLTNEEKGLLFQHLLEYVNDINPILEDRLILTAWKPIETHLKRDLKKWTDKAPQRSDKARKAGLASAKARELKATKSNSLVENELKPTKSTVNVSVNVNDNVIKNINTRKQEFYNSLIPFLNTYNKEMLKDFFEYWSEHGERDRKFRKEKEKSFNTELRLKTWFKRSKQFKEKNSAKKEKPIMLSEKMKIQHGLN